MQIGSGLFNISLEDFMRKNHLTSAFAFGGMLICAGFFYAGMRNFDATIIFSACFIASLAALIASFLLVSRLRCSHCDTKLEIELTPSYNQLLHFFLWTGAEARCAHCHEKV